MRYCTLQPPRHQRAIAADQPLHQADAEALPRPPPAKESSAAAGSDRRPGPDDWLRNSGSQQTGSVHWAGLVDDGQIELPLAEHFAVEAGQGRAHDRRAVEDALDGQRFQLAGVVQEGAAFLAELLARPGSGLAARPFAGLAKQAERFLGQLACLARVVMILDHQVERVFAQGGQDAGGMAEPHRPFAVRPAAVRAGCPRPGCSERRPAPSARAARPGESARHGRRLAGAGRAVQDGDDRWRTGRNEWRPAARRSRTHRAARTAFPAGRRARSRRAGRGAVPPGDRAPPCVPAPGPPAAVAGPFHRVDRSSR